MIVSARFDGVCADCGDDIDMGDPIRYDDDYGGWVHAACDPKGTYAARMRCLVCADLIVDDKCPNCEA